MIYEGTNTCFGTTGGPRSSNFYSTVGVATSADYGHTWPTYRGSPSFSFVALPDQNTMQGPSAPSGALGSATCVGADCATSPASNYGRYALLSPPGSLATAMATGKPLPGPMGNSEPSAFVDDAGPGPARYLYEAHVYTPGELGGPPLADGRQADLGMARAQLNGGTEPLSFTKWDGQHFTGAGIGGVEVPVLPDGPAQSCAAVNQRRNSASINYVDAAGQYLLTFICESPGDPASGQTGKMGAAWFYSTSYDISDATGWSQPKEITGSWSEFDTSGGCPVYRGWYPTFMSLGGKPGHLSSAGYVFYLRGCVGSTTPPPGRQYSSRAFTITTSDFSLAFDPSTIDASAGSKIRVTLTINRSGGFTGNITLTPQSSEPAGIKLPGFPVSTTGNSVSFKIKIKGSVRAGTYPIIVAGKDDAGNESDATLTLVVQ